jgi:hypothetical protein
MVATHKTFRNSTFTITKVSSSESERSSESESCYSDETSAKSEKNITLRNLKGSGSNNQYDFIPIADSNYKKPKKGSFQDNLTKDEIKEKLIGYRSLKTADDKRYLLKLQPFKEWIKYYNTITKQFRIGGLLIKVDPELKYITLANTNKNLTWSVQLKDNIIFVKDPELKKEASEKKVKEKLIKEKLYQLFKDGRLKKI